MDKYFFLDFVEYNLPRFSERRNVFFKSQQEHLVLTDEYDGLIVDKAKRAIEILNQ